MGLSSSQGRLLMLTSRLSDVQLAEIMISRRQNQLAWNTQEIASEYTTALNNYKYTIKVSDDSSSGYTKQDINYQNLSAAGYLVTNSNEQIYLEKDEDGNWIIPQDKDGNDLLSIDETTGKATINGTEYEVLDGSKYLSSSEKIQNGIENGVLFILDTNNKSNDPIVNISASTNIEYVLDTSDDAQAESKYDYELAQISRQSNMLDMELQQLETQHNALLKEIESEQKVIENNIDRTFKLFEKG